MRAETHRGDFVENQEERNAGVTSRYRSQLYPVLARLDAERAHRLALRALDSAQRVPGGPRLLRRFAPAPDPRLRVERLGLVFPNPLGVAAGLDKNAEAVGALFALGFGAVEVGTITPRPQPGNPPPRLWRFPAQQALVNALGFPSAGAASVRRRLAGRRFPGVGHLSQRDAWRDLSPDPNLVLGIPVLSWAPGSRIL